MLTTNEQDIIFDRYGAATLRILKSGRIITWMGEHIGFLSKNLLYNYNGDHVGWYEGGIVRDNEGATVGFGLKPTGVPRPYLPYKQYLPYRGYIQYAPYLPYKSYPNFRPYKQYGWSELNPVELFLGADNAD
ncbi:MAG: hypothetical protein JWN26_408 [Candidatus Saccharibacteria bacterium]|nr:hypothetical protein [Candidatus Saccharibacteria bacterium]